MIRTSPVQPDELLAVASSYDESGRFGTQTPFNDQLAFHWEAGKWEADSMHNSLVTVGNGGNQTVRAELTILYNQGQEQYQMEQKLAPEEQMLVDFGKLIREQIPDKSGHVLPPDVTSGAYRVRDLTDQAVGNLYEGKVIVDKTNGHAAYGCAVCCGYTGPAVVFDPLPVTVSGTSDQKITATNGCTGQRVDVTYDFFDWWTDNTAIATAQAYKITGVAAGSTNHHAQSVLMSWSGKTYGQCPQSKGGAGGGTYVVGPPDHLSVVVDNEGYPSQCPATGVYLRQMQMQVVDANNKAVLSEVSIQEAFSPAQPSNSCGNGSPVPSSCAATGDGGVGQFIDSMSVSGNLCGSGIKQSSGCGYSLTSTWSTCGSDGSKNLWVSPRVTHSNGAEVDGIWTKWNTGTQCTANGCK